MSSHQNPHHSWVDVLIVGAGPAGLMSANALSRMGVNLRIVDKRPHKLAAGQADGIQPRTIEVLQSYGLAERLLKEGNQMHVAAFYNPSADGGIERINRAPDVTAPTARFPFEVTLHQGAIENIFVDSLREHGVTVRRHTLPLSLELSRDPAKLRDPHSYPITVSLSDLDNPHSEPEIVHAKYLVGADGAHSWVRRTCGIEMEGEDTEYVWGVLDIYPDTDFPDIRNRTAIHSNNGACMIIPREGDKVRLYVQLNRDAHLASAGEPITKDVMTFDKIMKVAKKSFAPYRIDHTGEPEWWSIYKIRQQVANRFSLHERIFIAGDACHTHSPKAGQGMNASMNDSHNLAWKLTHVLRGWADLSLLKTYEFERRKYAQDLIAFDRKFAALFSGAAAAAGDTAAMGVSHEQFLQVFQTFGGFTSGIGIHYAPSSLVHPQQQGCMPGLVVGQRVIPSVVLRAADSRPYEIQDLLPSDGKHKLLVFCGPANDQRMQESMRALNAALGKRMWPAGGREAMMDVLVFCQGKTREVNWTDVAPSFKLHWTKVFVDDVCAAGRIGGHLYETYGVGTEGAVAIIRPDGYVGSVFPLAQAEGVDSYFSAALGLKSNSESEMSQARL